MASKINKSGCTATYSWSEVKHGVQCLYRQKHSLRAVAREFGNPITHSDIQRILQGKEPRDPRKRKALNLSSLVPAPACPHCGIVHISKRCPSQRKQSRDLFSMSVAELRWRLEHREAF
jgi:hypothetical protein